MRRYVPILLMCLTAVAWGQHRGVVVRNGALFPAPATPPAVGHTGVIGQGFGNVVFPGTGIPNRLPSVINPGGLNPGPLFPEQLGGTIGGGNIPGYSHGRRGRGRAVIPVVVGAYPYGYDYPQQPANITIINQPPQNPPIIINQNFAPERVNPVVRDYNNEPIEQDSGVQVYRAPIPSNPEPESRAAVEAKPTIYLLAFKDGAIYQTYAIWRQEDTVHYITTKNDHNKASLALVDVDLTDQLNTERGLEFDLK